MRTLIAWLLIVSYLPSCMRTLIAWLLIVSYLPLLFGAYAVPRCGPQQVVDLSVAADGTFTTSSWLWNKTSERCIDLWSADLSRRNRVTTPSYLNTWAHSISADGKRLAFVVTEDGLHQVILILDPVSGDIKSIADPGTFTLITSLSFCGPGTSNLIAVSDEVVQVGPKGINRFVADVGPLDVVTAASYCAIPNNRSIASGDNDTVYTSEYSFFRIREDGDVELVRQEQQTTELPVQHDWAAVGVGGRIAFLRDGLLRIQSPDDVEREFSLSEPDAALLEFDPREQHLLVQTTHGTHVVDCSSGRILATRSTNLDWRVRQSKFQDAGHVIFAENMSGAEAGSRSGRVVRWNWRTGEEVAASVGGLDLPIARILRAMYGIVLFLWLIGATWLARLSADAWTCYGILGAILGLLCALAYWHPEYRDFWLYGEWSYASLVILTLWFALPIFVSLSIRRFVLSRVAEFSLLAIAWAISSDRLHHLTISEPSWFLPAVNGIVMCSLFVLHCVFRRYQVMTGLVDRWLRLDTVKETKLKRSNNLLDLILLTTVIAIACGIVSRWQAFDLDAYSFRSVLNLSVAMLALTVLALLTARSQIAWPIRFFLFVAGTSVTSWLIYRANWIDSGELYLVGSLLGCFSIVYSLTLTYMLWLGYRRRKISTLKSFKPERVD